MGAERGERGERERGREGERAHSSTTDNKLIEN